LDANPEVQLLFTDIVMPDMNGRQLAEEAQRRSPSLKVLYTTGYTRDAIVHNGVLDADVQLISKPFTLEQLAHKVRELCDSPGK
jgi:two-component SAPR family response regulator